MLSPEDSNMAANAICHAAEMTRESIRGTLHDIYIEHRAYSVLLRPKLFIDGNQWCALYGDDLQHGVAGFGDSPGKALVDFDNAMCKSLSATNKTSVESESERLAREAHGLHQHSNLPKQVPSVWMSVAPVDSVEEEA